MMCSASEMGGLPSVLVERGVLSWHLRIIRRFAVFELVAYSLLYFGKRIPVPRIIFAPTVSKVTIRKRTCLECGPGCPMASSLHCSGSSKPLVIRRLQLQIPIKSNVDLRWVHVAHIPYHGCGRPYHPNGKVLSTTSKMKESIAHLSFCYFSHNYFSRFPMRSLNPLAIYAPVSASGHYTKVSLHPEKMVLFHRVKFRGRDITSIVFHVVYDLDGRF